MKRQLLNKSTNADTSGIAAGQTNRIGDNIGTAANHSFIGGGQLNCICAQHSAILGGNNNKVTHNCAAVFGNGITSCDSDVLHVNRVITQNVYVANTALAYGGLPNGAIYTDNPVVAGPWKSRILYVK